MKASDLPLLWLVATHSCLRIGLACGILMASENGLMLSGPQWVWWNDSAECLRSANAIRLTIDKTRVVCDPPDPFCPLDLFSTTSLVLFDFSFCDDIWPCFELLQNGFVDHPAENMQNHHDQLCRHIAAVISHSFGVSPTQQVKRSASWRSGCASKLPVVFPDLTTSTFRHWHMSMAATNLLIFWKSDTIKRCKTWSSICIQYCIHLVQQTLHPGSHGSHAIHSVSEIYKYSYALPTTVESDTNPWSAAAENMVDPSTDRESVAASQWNIQWWWLTMVNNG